MRDLRDLSGPWVGFWVQAGRRGEMRLAVRFGESSVEGGGNDRVGPFTITGHHEAIGVVGFGKEYPSHGVDYAGIWDGAMIVGRWRLRTRFAGKMGRGEFEIWPEGDDQAIERMEEALAAVG